LCVFCRDADVMSGGSEHQPGGSVVKNLVTRFLQDESGATAIEYGLIAAGISVAIITILKGVGTKLTSTFTSVKNALN
jgi:pilus assembly protein Flp/PilA